MAIVTITQAAKLVRRGRASMYRDIDKGLVSKTVSASGEAGIETSELIRVYGKLHLPETPVAPSPANDIADFGTKMDAWTLGGPASIPPHETPGDNHQLAILELELREKEEKIVLLERIVALERESRQLAAASMRRELDGKEQVIELLKHQVLMLEYTTKPTPPAPAPQPASQGFLARWFRKRPAAGDREES